MNDPLIATSAKMLPFIHALAAETAQICSAAASHFAPSDAPLAAANAAHAQFEQTWTLIQSIQPAALDCKAECSYCCFLTAETTGAEAFLMARYLRDTRTPEQFCEIEARIAETAGRVQGLSPEARAVAKIPCALLENGQCSVYPVRPLGCRAWNSRSASACESVLRGERGDLREFQDQRLPGIHAGVGAGLAQALNAAGLPEPNDAPCELNAGLRIALSEPDAARRWRAGEDVFAPARIASETEKREDASKS